MDASVRAMYGDTNKRKDLFNLWLNHAREFGQVRMELSRRNVNRQSSHANTVTWSKVQLEQSGRYTTQDIEDLIKRCTDSGRYLDDPNFPGNERLRRYVIIDEVGSQHQRLQEDEQRIANAGNISTGEALNLTDQGLLFNERVFEKSTLVICTSRCCTFINVIMFGFEIRWTQSLLSFPLSALTGGDFSQALAPTFQDVLGQGQAVEGNAPDKGKGAKGRGKGRGKTGKGKGGENPGQPVPHGEDPNPPLQETTPIQKAKALAKSVFLGCTVCAMFVLHISYL